LGDQKLARAKAILMANRGTSENEAYREMREQAMARRVPIDEIANSIINAEQLLRPSQKHD
jgi:AmiR/NasT family two-component response regulator